MFSGSNIKKSLLHYITNLVFIWLGILLYRTNKYYLGFLREDTQAILLFLALAYTAVGFPYHLVSTHKGHESKGYKVISMIFRMLKDFKKYIDDFVSGNELPKISKEEKRDLLFLLVKLFFLPIMINFVLGNFYSSQYQYNLLKPRSSFSITNFNDYYYPFLISFFFLIDTAFFTFGYAIESKLLKNQVKSVEPTFLGWAVALICYPPFNQILGWYTPWYSNDYFKLGNWTFFARVIVILLLAIYVWATIALGAKASNLTNRGIVAKGPYRFIRHPAYISKNLVWWVTALPVMSIAAFLGLSLWTFIYFMRAITEERHLMQDDDYKEYMQKVKYRFIPGIF